MKAIYKKELRSYFSSVIAFLFIAVTLFFVGLYFTSYNIFGGYPQISYALASSNILFLITIPILTMKILAEEKKQKTDQLILTAPVSVEGIVTGKFLSLLTIYAIPTAVVALFPLILSLFGTVSLTESYLAILGFFLYGAMCIAIGIFISSLTESQVIAAVLSFVALFLGFVMSGICSLISSSGNWLTQILSAFDTVGRFQSMLSGTLEIKSIVYFLSVIVLMLFLTTQAIQKRRYSMSVKNLKFGAFSTGMIAIVTVIVVVVNFMVSELPSKYTSIDMTSNKLFSITDETKAFLSRLEEDITVYVLNSEKNADTTLSSTLERLADTSKHVKVEYVDPAVNPKFYLQYTTDNTITTNSMIVVGAKRNKVINYTEVYEQEVDYTTYTSQTTGYDGEGQLISAMAYVTSDNMPKVYFLEGHKETALEASFTDAMEKANMEYETINLLKYDAVPEDSEAIFINAPTVDFSKEDADKVIAYLENGGKAFITTTYVDTQMPNFQRILDYYQVSLVDGMVVETDKNYYYQDPMYLLPTIGYATETSSLTNGSYIFAPYTKGIAYNDTEEDQVEVTELLTSSASSFSKTNLESATSLTQEENDVAGPFAIGVKVVKTNGDKESELFLFSTLDIFTEAADRMVSGANLELFAGCMGSFTGQESNISIPVKSFDVAMLTIPQANIIFISLMLVVIAPISLLLVGIIIWFRRRKKV